MRSNSGPGYKKNPEHRIAAKPAGGRVRVTFNGEVIADSREAVRMDEGNYAAVYYLPRKDVKMGVIKELLAFYPDKVDSIVAEPG